MGYYEKYLAARQLCESLLTAHALRKRDAHGGQFYYELAEAEFFKLAQHMGFSVTRLREDVDA